MKYVILFIPLLFIACSKCDNSCATPKSINGWWSDSASTSFSNCYASFQLVGDSVFMTHYIEFNQQPFFETGKGIVKDDSLIYDVIVRHGIEGWSTAGTHRLAIKNDSLLEGNYSDNKGNKGPLVFRRIWN